MVQKHSMSPVSFCRRPGFSLRRREGEGERERERETQGLPRDISKLAFPWIMSKRNCGDLCAFHSMQQERDTDTECRVRGAGSV